MNRADASERGWLAGKSEALGDRNILTGALSANIYAARAAAFGGAVDKKPRPRDNYVTDVYRD